MKNTDRCETCGYRSSLHLYIPRSTLSNDDWLRNLLQRHFFPVYWMHYLPNAFCNVRRCLNQREEVIIKWMISKWCPLSCNFKIASGTMKIKRIISFSFLYQSLWNRSMRLDKYDMYTTSKEQTWCGHWLYQHYWTQWRNMCGKRSTSLGWSNAIVSYRATKSTMVKKIKVFELYLSRIYKANILSYSH